MRYQLRDYRIRPGAMTEFVNEWRASVVPIRRRFGFEVVGAWSNAETNRFVWIIGHEADFEEADRMYYTSPERTELSPNPARFIDETRTEFVSPAL